MHEEEHAPGEDVARAERERLGDVPFALDVTEAQVPGGQWAGGMGRVGTGRAAKGVLGWCWGGSGGIPMLTPCGIPTSPNIGRGRMGCSACCPFFCWLEPCSEWKKEICCMAIWWWASCCGERKGVMMCIIGCGVVCVGGVATVTGVASKKGEPPAGE